MAYWSYRRPYWKKTGRYGWGSNSYRRYKPRGPYNKYGRQSPKTKVLYLTTLIPYNNVQLYLGPMVISTRIPVYWSYDVD